MKTTFGIIGLLCAIWVIYDVWANRKSMEPLHKILWTAAAVLFNILTAIIYLIVKKK